MRIRTTAAAAVATAAALVLVTGCGKATGNRASDTDGASASPTASPTPSVNPSYGEQFLAEGECAAPEPNKEDIYREVPCKDPKAVAKVETRTLVGSSEPFSATSCPKHADFAIDVPLSIAILESKPATGEGYACMRNLKPPHPGDTGGGGGPSIEVGDCVHSTPRSGDFTAEVACRTKGEKNGATHKVTKILEDGLTGGFSSPCDGVADATFTENPLFDSDPVRNDRVLCADEL
ncbi:hypothetical protein ACIO87_35570 [Streptomyces sp. NPDC087218]|uniref:hypothetical protein n=1 Tax=Streptomyces sp. NPDC087218 TaxID=3365769 RepID=UPI003804DECB